MMILQSIGYNFYFPKGMGNFVVFVNEEQTTSYVVDFSSNRFTVIQPIPLKDASGMLSKLFRIAGRLLGITRLILRGSFANITLVGDIGGVPKILTYRIGKKPRYKFVPGLDDDGDGYRDDGWIEYD